MDGNSFCMVARSKNSAQWNIFTFPSKDAIDTAMASDPNIRWMYSDYLITYSPGTARAFSARKFSSGNWLTEDALRDLMYARFRISLTDHMDFQSEAERLLFILKHGIA